MLVSLSQYLNVDENELRTRGVFNTILNSDSLYFINFMCLKETEADELLDSYDNLNSKFRDIATLLIASKSQNDRFYREALKRLDMSELEEICLGYAMFNTSGSGSGLKYKQIILNTAKEIIEAGLNQPEIFQLVGLLEEGIGPDRISDMIGRMIYDDLVSYSRRIYAEILAIEGANQNRKFKDGILINEFNNKPLLLLPLDILNDLPIASEWEDIDYVCMINEELRRQINNRIGNEWEELSTEYKKKLFKEIVLSDISILKGVIKDYISADIKKYDFYNDDIGDASWHEASRNITNSYPLDISNSINSKPDVISIVRTICMKFKTLIEYNGLNEVLYSDSKKPRRERIAQKLFYAVAHSYCENNNLDISPEVNSGRGPVDFKFSYGNNYKVLVEVKLTRNPQLIHGYEKQLIEYEKSERTDDSFYLVIDNGGSRDRLDELIKIHRTYKDKGIKIHDLVIIDSKLKKSASAY